MPTLLAYSLLFAAVGVGFILVHLLAGMLVRPMKPEAEKLTVYECGEPTVGSAWVQFDLRYYVVALLFVIFEVEVAFFFPWAVVFGKLNAVSNSGLQPEQRQELTAALLPPHAQPRAETPVAEQATSANHLAWIAFVDILVFFGVLLVGFAYLWRRGDINWIRSTAAAPPTKAEPSVHPPAEVARPPLVEVG
jgi:NADH-quinone oxidoreductase subunit A